MVAGLAIVAVVMTVRERARHRQIAEHRRPWTRDEFIQVLTAEGVATDSASFVWDCAERYYFAPLRPQPDDNWASLPHVDPEDLEGMAANFWKLRGVPQPSRRDPVYLPADPALGSFAQWLDNNAVAP